MELAIFKTSVMVSHLSESAFFDVIAPAQWTVPAVLNSPHSGASVPVDLLHKSILSELELRRSEDRFVDELFANCVGFGAPLLRAKISRAYVDLNREPFELDPDMFEDRLPPHSNTVSPRVISGLGTIPKVVGDAMLIYGQKLKLADAVDRIDRVYRPYHRALSSLLNHVHDRIGFVCLIDCHSMPSTATQSGSYGSRSVDVVLGDRHGGACSPVLLDIWRSGFEAAGLKVKLNHPYPGGFITETYGQPRLGRHALQIELNRALYLTGGELEKNSNFKSLQSIIQGVFEVFARTLPTLAEDETRIAAE
jgi:N-formylglutamate amidohydrolase